MHMYAYIYIDSHIFNIVAYIFTDLIIFYSGHGLALSILSGKLISEKIDGNSKRFNFISSIKNLSIPFGE